MMQNRYLLPTTWVSRPLRVAVLGCGGTGYYIATQLLMLERALVGLSGQGFERIDLFDAKAVAAPNLARTGFVSYEVGFNKAEILANRLNTALDYSLFCAEPNNATKDHLLNRYDLIITATDSIESRMMVANLAGKLDHRHRSRKVLWLDTGVDKATATCVLGELSTESDRLPVTTDLFTRLPESDTTTATSCDMAESLARQAFGVNQHIAGIAINLLSQLLMHGEISYHGAMVDLKSGFTSPINVSKEIWASFGYSPRLAESA